MTLRQRRWRLGRGASAPSVSVSVRSARRSMPERAVVSEVVGTMPTERITGETTERPVRPIVRGWSGRRWPRSGMSTGRPRSPSRRGGDGRGERRLASRPRGQQVTAVEEDRGRAVHADLSRFVRRGHLGRPDRRHNPVHSTAWRSRVSHHRYVGDSQALWTMSKIIRYIPGVPGPWPARPTHSSGAPRAA